MTIDETHPGIADTLNLARAVQELEAACDIDKRPQYRYTGRTTNWGDDLSEENKRALDDAELVVLLDRDSNPHSTLLRDGFGTLREKKL